VETLPNDVTVECNAVPTAPTLTATDNCGTATVTYNEVNTAGTCPGSYTLTRTWLATDLCGMIRTHVQTITVKDTAAPTLTTPLSTSVNVNCNQIPVTPQLQFTDGCSSTSQITVVTSETTSPVSSTGSYTIIRKWTVSDACNNSQIFTQTIYVTPVDYVQSFTADGQCDLDNAANVKLIDLINSNFPGVYTTTGTWTDVNNSGAFDQTNGIFYPYNLTGSSYLIRYTNNDPVCPKIIEITIPIDRNSCIVEPCATLDIHNAVTPNGDGMNEFFFIENIELACYNQNSVEIYNRWGVKVFETENYDNASHVFTGISEGRDTVNQSAELPTGTYFYILKYKNIKNDFVSKSGYLYLTR
ncbi:gliding motility-associated C-terminal domain-containing protein, partial [Flavobacterium sp. SUN046]|uniref:T9SS type B sorting domain-containing protein n=1 Tax=Flavobacterium sp. SUN046 TaxID=3002440 RepID=UPI002DBFA1C2